ncbi:hypothetical protein M413DRAFT_18954 [Hebeloma cylindrosporum]|uniref:Uncharacterized protein n=1 Tax=Hebeloma cylindrosporum TaxID=76867 RepID=A0A0C2YK55_HEBCY|nr:hypothetical protein M413DRAFT_18954 [Hebeloma cylindrosporum h7]
MYTISGLFHGAVFRDFGHKTFWHSLTKQRDEVEGLLEDVERRAYELLLASQNAMWVLDQQHEPPAEECGVFDDEQPLSKPQKKPLPSAPIVLEDIEDPLDVAMREKRFELLGKIWARLARYCAPAKSRYYKEREAEIWACVCRAVYTDPSLMLVAQNYQCAISLVKDNDSKLDLPTVERLWAAIKSLYVDDVRAAIDDVLHPVRPKGEYVVVLGTRVHKGPTESPLPLHAWGHMTALFPCYSCVRKVCKTVDDIVALTRYAILSGSGLAQSYLRYDFGYDGYHSLALCGFIPNNIEDLGPRYSIKKDNSFNKHDRPQWTETKSNYAICVGLSLTDPRSQEFVNACLRHPDLQVLCRKGRDGRLIRSKPLLGTQTRVAESRAALKTKQWDVRNAMYFNDTILQDALPVVSATQRLEDCFQVAIVDDGDGDMQDFVDKLEKIWFEVYDAEALGDLLRDIGGPYLHSKELEFDDTRTKPHSPLMPTTEPDILVSYERLWGRAPREGRLVDDELNVYYPK